jgi:hypothetical protein
MFITINNVYQFRDAFHNAGRRSQFSYEGLELLFTYLEEINPDYELDVVALCCDYSEDSVETIARDYLIDLSEAGDGICTASAYGLEQVKKAQFEIVMDYLNENCSVVGVTPSGLIVYAQF